jgi:mRNA interferase MazF
MASPALVAQSNLFMGHPSATVPPITRELGDTPVFRVTIIPNKGSGLQNLSKVMVDKAMTAPREKCGDVSGRLEDTEMLEITRALAVFLGIA